MTVLLDVSASPRGDASHSRRAGLALIGQVRKRGNIQVIDRNLSKRPLCHPDHAFVEASLMAEADRGPRETSALALSEELIAELEIADLVVIDAPMHNFTVPSVLKSWIDHVVRPGRTFRSTPNGKMGLFRDRPVFVVAACRGTFPSTGTGQTDFLTPYLLYVLETLGMRDASALRLDCLRRGDAAVAQAEAMAADWVKAKAAGWHEWQNKTRCYRVGQDPSPSVSSSRQGLSGGIGRGTRRTHSSAKL